MKPKSSLCPASRTVIVLFAMAFTLLLAVCSGLAGDATTACIDESERASGIKATLVTVWNGTPEFLPEDVGVSDDCTRPVHTVDNSSYVYIVGDGKYTVGDFFEVWEDSPDTRPGAIVENISLNGQAFNGDYRAIVFEDDQRIVVAFGDRTP